MSTRAIQHLNRRQVSFELVAYDHREKGAAFAAEATGHPLARTVKTLVADLGHKHYCLALVAGNRQLDLKLLAAVCGVKRAAMVDKATAERLTGYLLGGISPFGTRQDLPVVMDSPILSHGEVLINAGRRGMMLKMSPAEIKRALDCVVGDISK